MTGAGIAATGGAAAFEGGADSLDRLCIAHRSRRLVLGTERRYAPAASIYTDTVVTRHYQPRIVVSRPSARASLRFTVSLAARSDCKNLRWSSTRCARLAGSGECLAPSCRVAAAEAGRLIVPALRARERLPPVALRRLRVAWTRQPLHVTGRHCGAKRSRNAHAQKPPRHSGSRLRIRSLDPVVPGFDVLLL